MDWSKTEMQTAVADLARQILKDDPANWGGLAEAQLLGVDDVLDVCALLEQVGRSGAFVPALETVCLGWPLRQGAVEGLADDAVLTAGLHEAEAHDPRCAATTVVDGKATGAKIAVPALHRAVWVAIPAVDGVYAVRTEDCDVALGEGTHDEPLGTLTMDGVPAVKLGDRSMLDPWLQRVDLGIAALLLGLAKQGLRLTATYVSDRKQFGRPIGTFQAVGQRAADAWIDVQGMEVSLWSAAWALGSGADPQRAERALLIARWQAAEGAHRVLSAAQHLHGGMGYDKDYPLYRYTLTASAWEHVLGGPQDRLERLGDHLAAG